MTGFDIIGDVHGHADELELLLDRLGYVEVNGVRQHPEGRQAVFLGDLIDRGPAIRRVLERVKGMTDHGSAMAVMGNHELNAFTTKPGTRRRANGYVLIPKDTSNSFLRRSNN